MIQHGGLVYYGGFIGAAIAGIIYIRWKKMPLWKTADVLGAQHRAGQRVWPHRLPAQRLLLWPRLRSAVGNPFPAGAQLPAAADMPVHPTEIYDALLNLILYGFLAWLFRRKKFDGQVFATYLLCYAVTRSIVEYFRGDYSNLHYHLGLTPAQWIGVPIFIAGLALAAVLRAATGEQTEFLTE